MDSPSLEATEAIGAAGATHPRVTLNDIKTNIRAERYFTVGDALNALGEIAPNETHLLTVCVLVMRNGFVVLGKSAPASAENFDAEKGRLFAYENAIGKIWPLMGFALRDRLAAFAEVEPAHG